MTATSGLGVAQEKRDRSWTISGQDPARPPRDLDLVIVGPLAPPHGGIASHVERLAALLVREGLNVGILNHFSRTDDPLVIAALRRNPFRYWWEMRRLNAPVVHYHHARWSTLIAAALARGQQGGSWIVTIHGHEVKLASRHGWAGPRALTRWALSRFDRVIAVSDAVAEALSPLTTAPVTVIPAYLPAHVSPQFDGDGERPPAVVVSAYRVGSSAETDLYGIDVAGSIYAAAHATIPDLRLELYLSQPPRGRDARRYLDRALEPARAAGSSEHVTVHVGEELAPAFFNGAIYLRPTRTDGDAVSVREALDAGVPVIASDLAKRPHGVVTVPLEDTSAWVAAISNAVDSADARTSSVEQHPPSIEHARALISIYRSLLADTRAAAAANAG